MRVKYVPSLKDVAERSGVSITTVSRVLSGKGVIGDATREKILKVANELGYRSNLLISGMRNGHTKTIGVIVPNGDHFFSGIYSGVHDSLIAKDYCPIHIWQDRKGENELAQIHRLIDRRVEGMIIRPVEDDADKTYFQEIYDRRVPVVLVNRRLANIDFPFVGSDDVLGARIATEHLMDLGHRRIAHFQGPQYASPARMRKRGFEKAVAERSGATGIIPDIEDFSYNLDSAKKFLSEIDGATAVFAGNDYTALALMRAAEDIGVVVPDDLSIVGYGDIYGRASGFPLLTTVNQFPEMIGETAVDMLFKQINGEKLSKKERIRLLPPELLIGESSMKYKSNKEQMI
jgi:LacI family transcriptional regulator